jgi:hypothetical protein
MGWLILVALIAVMVLATWTHNRLFVDHARKKRALKLFEQEDLAKEKPPGDERITDLFRPKQ